MPIASRSYIKQGREFIMFRLGTHQTQYIHQSLTTQPTHQHYKIGLRRQTKIHPLNTLFPNKTHINSIGEEETGISLGLNKFQWLMFYIRSRNLHILNPGAELHIISESVRSRCSLKVHAWKSASHLYENSKPAQEISSTNEPTQ